MDIRPLGDKVLVKPLKEDAKTKGGLFLPETAEDKPQRAKVIAAGPGKVSDKGKLLPLTLKKGQTVIFGKYSGHEVKIEGEEYIIMPESDILAIVE